MLSEVEQNCLCGAIQLVVRSWARNNLGVPVKERLHLFQEFGNFQSGQVLGNLASHFPYTLGEGGRREGGGRESEERGREGGEREGRERCNEARKSVYLTCTYLHRQFG